MPNYFSFFLHIHQFTNLSSLYPSLLTKWNMHSPVIAVKVGMVKQVEVITTSRPLNNNSINSLVEQVYVIITS